MANELKEEIRQTVAEVYTSDWSLVGDRDKCKHLLHLLHSYFPDVNFGYEPYGILITIKVRDWVTDHGMNPFI